MAASGRGTAAPGAALQVKRLLRLSRIGALATLTRGAGAPLTTFVGCASDFDGAPLFLLSTLAQHTQNLAADSRASLLLTNPSRRGDPLNHPRVSLGGSVLPHSEPRARKRYLQRNPKAKLYAPFQDFAIYRMRVETVHFNGGFGRAAALTPSDVLTPEGDAAALIEAEERLIEDINRSGGALAAHLARGEPSAGRVWRAIGLDAEGLDLCASGRAARIDLAGPAFDPQDWRRRLDEALAGGNA